MACDDRQLTEAQRVAGYQNQRTGVQQAVRPFSGRPTLENLIDYINRELQPAVRRTRDAVNDVYLQVADNAPSGNPLAYYFSTETAAADPTVGRIRLDASPQNTATTIRISQTNARLVDVAPWLDVMAGSSTTPLGVVTLSDAINPGRAIRFDLSTMVDQGDYWDLGVTVIESTHDDPFVEGEAVVLAFIPGVASTGTTVPPGALTPIGPNTVLGNPTTSTAAPTEIPLNPLSVLGRQGITGTGNIESIDVPDTSVLTGESVFLRATSARTNVRFRNFTLQDLPEINNLKFIGNVSGATSRPIYTDIIQLAQDLFGIGFDTATHNFRLSDASDNTFLGNISGAVTHSQPTPLGDLSSATIIYENVGKSFIRETMDGDVFANQNSNVTLIQPNVVSDTKLRDSVALSVIGRSANSTGDPGDISAVAASGAVLRESGSALSFGTIATAGLADDSVTNTKLANMAAGTVKGRQIDAGTGDPVDLIGSEIAEIIRWSNVLVDSVGGTYTDHALDTLVDQWRFTATATITGIANGSEGRELVIENGAASGSGVTVTVVQFATSTAVNRFLLPDSANLLLHPGSSARFRYLSSRWRCVSATGTVASLRDGDKGDITTSSSGTVWTIDNDVVSDAKLRNSAALSVIGRSANSTGDPADIAAANDAEVLRRSGTTLGFGTVATAGLADDSVTNAKLAEMAANTVKANATSSTANPTDFAVGTNVVLGRVAADIVAAQLVNAQITDGTIANAKLANMVAGTVKGRQIDAGTGAPVDLVGSEIAEIIRWANVTAEAVGGTFNDHALDTLTDVWNFTATSTITGVAGGTAGRGLWIYNGAAAGSGVTVTVNQFSGSSTAANRFLLPDSANLLLQPGSGAFFLYVSSRWRCFAATGTVAALRDGDKGDITTSASGATWTIDNNVVSDAKLRDSGACSVIGRSANSSGDPGDISAATNDRVLTRASDSLAFRQISNGMIADGTIALGKIAGIGANTVIGNDTGSTTNPTTISVGTNTVLGRVAGNIVAAQLATGQIADDAVTDGKLRNSAALSVIGRSANSTGDVADIAAANDGEVLRRSGTTLGFGTVATAGIAANAVTNARLATMAQSSIKGRAESAGTGDPQDLNSTQVAAIIDGEPFAWLNDHSFGEDVRFDSTVRMSGELTSAATAANDLAIGQVNAVRFSGPVNPLTGMVPFGPGQLVILANVHASSDVVITLNSPSSTAANTFAGVGTDRHIKPGEFALAWYDGTSDQWLLLCRDEVDL